MKLKGQRNVTLEHDATPIQSHTEDALAKPRTKSRGDQAPRMKSTLSVTAMQAMRLMIGSGPNANSKRSLFSHETGIVFRTR